MIELQSNLIKKAFWNVYFINGTAYAGKSTAVKLLAQKYDGLICGENYTERLFHLIDREHQPHLSYFETMSGWQEFLSRTPSEYAAWFDGCCREGAQLELIELLYLSRMGKKIFVDTNIPLDLLREISDYRHVAIMLSSPSLSVERFFDRDDPEKQFLLEQIGQSENPTATMANFKAYIAEINSPERYREFAESGFFTLVRQETATVEETLAVLEKHFGLMPSAETK